MKATRYFLSFGLVFASMVVWANLPPQSLPQGALVEKVVVSKAHKTLVLVSSGEVIRSYRVSFGGDPIGHKEREGDERTPEGLYLLDYRNRNSAFHLSLHVSYPNQDDKRQAEALGEDPGGMIMVHGLPNRLPFVGRFHRFFNWTDGCIAMTNGEIEQVSKAVADGTPIEILP